MCVSGCERSLVQGEDDLAEVGGGEKMESHACVRVVSVCICGRNSV